MIVANKEAYAMTISTPHLYPVRLTAQQQRELEDVCRAGRSSARMIRRARVLLLSDRNRLEGKLTRSQVAQLASHACQFR
jgi:hypothetical protein